MLKVKMSRGDGWTPEKAVRCFGGRAFWMSSKLDKSKCMTRQGVIVEWEKTDSSPVLAYFSADVIALLLGLKSGAFEVELWDGVSR